MGYETKLIIGKTSSTEYKGSKYFLRYAEVDLCKCGYDSSISKIDWKNKTGKPIVHWCCEDKDITEDCYGDMPSPVPVKVVAEALREDVKSGEYRRFKWALALLESMENDSEGIEVLFYGY